MKNDFYSALSDLFLEDTPIVIYDNLILALKSDMRLISFDEDIYDSYKKAIQYFKKAESIYNENTANIKSKSIRKLLSGLMSVIKSRIAISDELELSYKKENILDNINPVCAEKKDIIEDAKKDIQKGIKSISETNANKMKKIFSENTGCAEYCKFYEQNYLHDIIRLNENTIYKYNALINDIEQRKVVAEVYSLLKEETQVLGAVIKVQADRLEKTNQTVDEENIIQKILFQLREAYQFSTADVNKIREKFNVMGNTNKIAHHCDLDRFSVDISKIESFIKENKNSAINKTENKLSGTEILTNRIISSFENILYFDKKNINSNEKKVCDILNGIDETLKIKTESLKESIEYLKNTVKSLDNIEKKISDFLRQNLLFELTTFEEITKYSVSRLRDINSAKKYVELVDNEVDNIEKYLNEYGITIIDPKPGDVFNAREHDVLMAEKNNQFKKGTIIKVMTKGYKKNDLVFVRATVIAAK